MPEASPGDPDPIERHLHRGMLEPNEVFGEARFRVWAQGATHASTTHYATLRSATDPVRSAWQKQPWVTPVVGSGPIGFPEDFATNAACLADLVVEGMKAEKGRGLGGGLDSAVARGADPAEFVEAFVNGLITRRHGSPVGPPPPVDERPDLTIDRSAVWVVVAAAQLTRTFHRMSLDSTRPISRWGSEKAEVARGSARYVELDDEYLPLLTEACRHAGDSLEARALRVAAGDGDDAPNRPQTAVALRAIAQLVEEIVSNIGSTTPHILLVHLEQLTDASWYLLAQTVLNGIDPGWTSLMLQLLLTQTDVRAAGLFRPRWNELAAVASRVGDVYSRASADAAARRRNQERPSDVTKFYDSVADVLWAQSESVRWARDCQRAELDGETGWMLPRPVAWVCSFDYEVELALWRAAEKRGHAAQFAVVMPVYVRRADRPTYGTLVWLEAVIDVPRGAKELTDADAFRRATTVSSWRLLSNTESEGGAGDETHHRPVVVHLLGCPLLDLPDISSPWSGQEGTPGENLVRSALIDALARAKSASPQESAVEEGPPRPALVHAVTVNEMLAVRQSARDFGQGSDTADSPSLPLDLFRSTGPATRMYAVLGVPLRDPAVRLRVTTVLTRGAPQVDENRDDDGLGLFVNKRVDDEELTVMGDLGLNVVKSRCEEFSDSLSGYAGWLREHCDQIDRFRGEPMTGTVAVEAASSRPQPDLVSNDLPTRTINEAAPRRASRWKELPKP